MRRPPPWPAAVVAVAIGVLGAGACGDGDADGGPGPVTSSAAPSTGSTATPAPATSVAVVTEIVTVTEGLGADVSGDGIDVPWNADTRPDTSDGSGDPALLTDFRVGRHEGYDRVVWEFTGGGAPGWRAQYVEEPTRDPSGEPVDLPGDATLSVTIMGVGFPGDGFVPEDATPYGGPETVTLDGDGPVTAAISGAVFEGYLDGFVGVRSEVPFRVYLLENPTRVVLEVRQ